MTDDQAPDRADVLPKAPDTRLPLDGDFYNRMIRSMQAMLQYNPEQIVAGASNPRLKFGTQVNYEALMVDASQPPFRTNGRQWSVNENQIAGGAGAQNVLEIDNTSSDAILLLDTLYKDASSAVGVAITFAAPGTAAGTLFVFDIERSPVRALPRAAPDVVSSKPTTVAGISALFRTETPAAYSSQIQVPTIAGAFPLGAIPVFPGENAIFFQFTANVTFQVTVLGRIWRFGTLSQLLTAA